ncbi:MAG: LegC family aminotransferase [Candidatus Omnitrophota bacterium]|nr:LegC family aminotransferase [Candidatus Omnitrophota bacterium]
MIPLSIPNISGKEWDCLKECLDTNWVSSSGSFLGKFEEAVCQYVHAKHGVVCINGTSCLFIALKLSGVGYRNEVIVPTLTFIAPVNVVRYLGAEPVFMDCDDYMNLDADKLEEFCRKECQITKKGLKNKKTGRIIKAIVPVHIFGNPCNMSLIMKIAERCNLKVIEDATESLGSYYCDGIYKDRYTGTISDFGVYSFNGNKIITTGGGGMIITDNKKLAKKARYFTEQAKDDSVRCIHNEIGYNFRLSNLQAALGFAQIKQLAAFIKIKKNNYELYKEELKNIEGIKIMGYPSGTMPNYWFYSLIIDKRKFGLSSEELMIKLAKNNIQTRPIWFLNHLQKPYRNNQAYKIEKAVWFWKKVLNIPCSTNLIVEEVKIVTQAIRRLRK